MKKEEHSVIRLEQLTKTYDVRGNKTEALKNITLTIERGEFVAIMGASGSGKSTLLNILGCMDNATSGEYIFNETAVSQIKRNKIHEFRKTHISFVFQNFALLNQYTVYENVELPLIAKAINSRERKRIIEKTLSSMNILDLRDKLPVHISGGQQQRCAIARALASGNELILADEPTGALDSKTSEEIVELLKEINAEGKTVLMVTHDYAIAKKAKRIIYINDGRIVLESEASREKS